MEAQRNSEIDSDKPSGEAAATNFDATALSPTGAGRTNFRSIGLSMFLHTALIVIAALFFTQTSPRGVTEGDRPAGLVLASVNDQQQVEFFDQQDFEPSEDQAETDISEAIPDQPPQLEPTNLDPLSNPLELDMPVFDSGTAIEVPGNSANSRIEQQLSAEQLRELEEERRRIAASKPRGEPVGINPFGLQSTEGRRFVFVLDRSKSMGEQGLGVLNQAARQLEQAVSALDQNHEFQIVAYHHDIVLLGETRGMLTGTEANKSLIGEFVMDLAAFGGTEHEKALITALGFRPDVVVFLTDGGYPKLNATQLATLTRICRSRTQINCIQFGSGPLQNSDNFMSKLASANSGEYMYIDVNQWKKNQ